jgi:hypothetical protein
VDEAGVRLAFGGGVEHLWGVVAGAAGRTVKALIRPGKRTPRKSTMTGCSAANWR